MSREWRHHRIPFGTKVSFGLAGGSRVYEVDQYQSVLECSPDCTEDHDCFDEPYINVRRSEWTCMPLSKLEFIYGDDHHGRPATDEDKQLYPGKGNLRKECTCAIR